MPHSPSDSPGTRSLIDLHAQAKRLSRTYVITLVLVALLCSLFAITIKKTQDLQQDNAALINLAGSQRSLSQRVAKCALALGSPLDPALRSAYRVEAETVLEQWITSRRFLFELEITQSSSSQLALFRKTEPYHQAMISALLPLLADRRPAADSAQSIDPNLAIILRAEAPFLEGMEQIVTGYQEIASTNLNRLSQVERALVGCVFLTLLGQAVFYFWSIGRRLIAAAAESLDLDRTRRHQAALLAALPDVVLIFDAKGCYKECRIPPGTAPFKPASELIGRHYADVLPAEVAAGFNLVRSRLAGDDAVASFTYTLPVAGVVHHYEAHCTRFGDDGILCLARDISKRHAAERALDEERLILRTIFDDSHAGFWDNDLALGIAFYSASYKAMLGFSDEEFPNLPDAWIQHAVAEDVAAAKACFVLHVASRGLEPYSAQLRFRHKDGSIRHAVSSGRVISWGPNGEPLRVVGCQFDVTALYAAQESIKRLTLVARHAGSTIIFADEQRRITWVNSSFTQITGYSESEAIGRNPSFLQGPATSSATVATIREALSAGKNFRGEILNYTKQGIPYWIDIEIIPDLDADGRKIGYIGVQADISARKQAEIALRERDERFAALSRHVPGVIYQFRLSSAGVPNFDFVSEGTSRVWGFNRDFVLSPEFTRFDHIHKGDRAGLSEAIVYSATHLTPFESTHRSHNPITGLRWVHAASTPTREANGDTVWHGYASDITDLVSAQQALRVSEENLRGIIEGIPAAIFLKDAAGRWLFVNQRGLERAAVSKWEWEGKTNEDFANLDPARAAFFQACSLRDEETWLNQKSITYEETTESAFGAPSTSEITKVPLFNPDGTRRALIMIVADISERKNAIAVIERERRLFAAGPVAVLITLPDPGWPITYVSENITGLLGYTAAELSADQVSYSDLVHPHDLPGLTADTHARLAEHAPFFESSYRLRHLDGSYRWFYGFTSPEYSSNRVCTSTRSYLFDQTKLKQAQDELRIREEQIAAISIHIPGVLYEFKKLPGGGCFPYASEGLRDLFDLEPADLREDATLFFKRIHPEDAHALDSFITTSFASRSDWESEFRILHPQRGLRWIHGSSSPRKLEDGSLVLDGYLFDITERKNNEDAMLRDGKREAIERLAGGVAHDFNNYLVVMSMSAEMLFQLPDASPRVRELATTLANEIDAATGVARQLLAFTRDQPLQNRSFVLEPFLRDCATFALRGSPMRCLVDIPDHTLELRTDADILRQVIFNLILNSRQAMEEKGSILIFAEASNHGTVCIRLADTGPGIPPSARANIFEPYFTTKANGSGLGLFVVRSLVLRLGGEIQIDTNATEGAAFVINLPLDIKTADVTNTPLPPLPRAVPKNEPAALPRKISASPARAGLHVLLLEDEIGQTNLLKEFFETMGTSVEDYSEGESLLAAAPAHCGRRASLVCLLDITVRGGAGGLEIVASLRKILPEARIFLVSGYSAKWKEKELSLDGLNIGFIAKPYKLRELENIVLNPLRDPISSMGAF